MFFHLLIHPMSIDILMISLMLFFDLFLAQIELLLNQGSICKCKFYFILFINIILIINYSNGFYNKRWKIIINYDFSSRAVLFFINACDRYKLIVFVVRWFVSLVLFKTVLNEEINTYIYIYEIRLKQHLNVQIHIISRRHTN